MRDLDTSIFIYINDMVCMIGPELHVNYASECGSQSWPGTGVSDRQKMLTRINGE